MILNHQQPSSTSTTTTNPKPGSQYLESWKGILLLWLNQVKVLIIKGLLQKRRRLLNTFFEILTPTLILLVLVYGSSLSPILNMPAFSNQALNSISKNKQIGSDIIDPNLLNNSNISELFNWLDAGHDLNSSNLSPFTSSLLFSLTVLPEFALPTSTLSQNLLNTMYTSVAAANRTIVPGLDRFVETAYATKILLSDFQTKQLQFYLPYVWEMIMGPGVLVIVGENTKSSNSIERTLSDDVKDFIAYLNTTSEHFEDVFGGAYLSVEDALQDYPADFDTQLRDPNFNQRNPFAQKDKPLWAILDFSNFDSSTFDFTYTIRMNSSFIPRTAKVIDMFPEGLGTEFAKYVQSGFLTLEYEVGEYIRRFVRKSNQIDVDSSTKIKSIREPFTDVFEGMMSYCGKADTASFNGEASQKQTIQGMFLQPTPNSLDEQHLNAFFQNIPVIQALPKFHHAPAFFLEFPCLQELQMYCVNPFKTDVIDVECLWRTNPWLGPMIKKEQISPTCAAFLAANQSSTLPQFSQDITSKCRLPIPPSKRSQADRNPVSPEYYDLDCMMSTIKKYSQDNPNDASLKNLTKYYNTVYELIHSCDSYRNYCVTNGGAANNNGIDMNCINMYLRGDVPGENIDPNSKCFQYMQAVGGSCRDEFATICNNDNFLPTASDFISDDGVFCLWKNSDLVSPSHCQQTQLYQDIAAVSVVNASYRRNQRYRDSRDVMCKFSNRIRALFANGITAGAFNTESFGQNQFYKNSSAFFGVIAAMAYLFFFTSLVRTIVQDKEKGSFRLFVQMGAHWSSFTASYVFLGLLVALPMSIIASFALWSLMKAIPTSIIFSLSMAYSVSVVSLAVFFASFFSNSNTAAAASPFFMFAAAIPGFVVFGGVTQGIFSLLTPSIMVVAFENIALVAQSSAPPSSLLTSLKHVADGMFGLSCLYLFVAVLYQWMIFNYGGCILAFSEVLSWCCSTSGGMTGTEQARDLNDRAVERRRAHQEGRARAAAANLNNNNRNVNNPENRGINEEELTTVTDTTANYSQQQNPNENVASNQDEVVLDYSGAVTSHTRNAAQVSVGGVSSRTTTSTTNNNRNPRQLRNSFSSKNNNNNKITNEHYITPDKLGVIFDDVWCFTMPSLFTGAHAEPVLTSCTFAAPKNCLTAICGISGSGKSTLLANCIGNSISINNMNRFGTIKLFAEGIEAETWQARLMSGVCPASDEGLWEQLTAIEHVSMIARIKGVMDGDVARTEARVILHALGLTKEDQEVARIFELSQGIKRRVSVAMALAGGTKFIALDEPSRSVDTAGRRKIYTLLSENASRGDRCILFSTNHIDEAEESADHMVLMHDLSVSYHGTPSGLLDQHLRAKMFAKAISMRRQTNNSCDVGLLESKVTTLLPSARLLNSVGREIRFEVPNIEDFEKIPLLIGELDQHDYGVGHFQVCDISLEDVTTKIIQELHAEKEKKTIKMKQEQLRRGNQQQHFTRQAVSSSSAPVTNNNDDENYSRMDDSPYSPTNRENDNVGSDDDDEYNNNNQEPSSTTTNSFFISPAEIEGNAIGTSIERSNRPTSGFTHHLDIITTVYVRRLASAFSGTGIFSIVMSLVCIFLALRILVIPDAPQDPLLLNPVSMYNNHGQQVIVGGNRQSRSMLSNLSLLQDSAVEDETSFSRYALIDDFWQYASTSPSSFPVDDENTWQVIHNHDEWNNSSLQISDFLFQTRNDHIKSRYGAFFLNDQFVSFYQDNSSSSSSENEKCDAQKYKYCDPTKGNLYYRWRTDTLLHNSTSIHALPAFLSTLLQARAQASGNNSKIRISVFSHPLPQNKVVFSSKRIAISLITSLLILVPFAFVPARYVATVVKERENGFLAVQSASNGLTIWKYWIATYLWHLSAYTCFAVSSVFLMSFFQESSGGKYGPLGELGLIFGLIEMSGACFIVVGYCISFLFRSHATALNFIINLSFLFGFALVAAVTSVDLIQESDDTKNAKNTNENLQNFFKLFPPFALGKGFLDLAIHPVRQAFSLDLDLKPSRIIGVNIGLMALFPMYLFMMIMLAALWRTRPCAELMEKIWSTIPWLRYKSAAMIAGRLDTDSEEALGFSLFSSPDRISSSEPRVNTTNNTTMNGDDDDEDERRRTEGLVEADSVFKTYKRAAGGQLTDALRGVSLSAGPGQFLVLTGENSSGTSTLLNVLCGAMKTDAGVGSFNGDDVFLQKSIEQVSPRAEMGICPELGGLDEDLTPLLLFNYLADLRALRNDSHRRQHIQFLLKALGLFNRREVKVRHLSTGERRRVSVGLAMVGFPRAILLDQASSNLDPISRRYLWSAITCAPSSEITWIMSTQHAEECHFLGTHAAILRRGRVMWNGPVNNKSDLELMQGCVVLTILKHDVLATSKKKNNARKTLNQVARVWGPKRRNDEENNNTNTSDQQQQEQHGELPGWEAAAAFVMDSFAPIQVIYNTNCANCYAIGSLHASPNRNMNFADESNNNNNSNKLKTGNNSNNNNNAEDQMDAIFAPPTTNNSFTDQLRSTLNKNKNSTTKKNDDVIEENEEEIKNQDNDDNNNKNAAAASSSSASPTPSRSRSSSTAAMNKKQQNNNNHREDGDKPTVQNVIEKLIQFQKSSACQFRFSCRQGSIEEALLMADQQEPEHSDLYLPLRY